IKVKLYQDLWQQPNQVHFQQEAGNEVLKGFWLKLTPMNAVASQPTHFYFLGLTEPYWHHSLQEWQVRSHRSDKITLMPVLL
ncbi:hypothetical protein, partial [Nostoc sp.]